MSYSLVLWVKIWQPKCLDKNVQYFSENQLGQIFLDFFENEYL